MNINFTKTETSYLLSLFNMLRESPQGRKEDKTILSILNKVNCGIKDNEIKSTLYEIVYFDKYGNYHNTNLEFKDKQVGIDSVNLKIGNHKEFDTTYIQLYESHYNEFDERISTNCIYEKEVSK